MRRDNETNETFLVIKKSTKVKYFIAHCSLLYFLCKSCRQHQKITVFQEQLAIPKFRTKLASEGHRTTHSRAFSTGFIKSQKKVFDTLIGKVI